MKKLFLLFSFALACIGCAQEKIINVQAEIKNSNGGKLTIYEGGTDELIKELETGNSPKIIKEIKGDSHGHLEGSFKGKNGFYRLHINDSAIYELYLKSGDDLKMNADAKNFDGTVVFSGKGAAEYNFLSKRRLRESKKVSNWESIVELDETAFKKVLVDLKTKELVIIENAHLDTDFTKTIKE